MGENSQTPSDDMQKRVEISLANRRAKSLFMATQCALAIKNGRMVYVKTPEGGLERIVTVPGFDDGTQLPHHPQQTKE